MKSVALLILWFGYAVTVYGINHVTKGCVPFKQVAWPQSNGITDPCSAASASSTTGPGSTAPATFQQPQSAAAAQEYTSGDTTASTVGNPYTSTNPRGGYTIKGQSVSKTPNPFHLPYTNLQ